MLTMLTLVVPASLGVFVDDVMAKHGTWGGLVTALLGGGVLVYVLSLLKHRFLKRLAVRVSVAGYSNGMSRLLRLPVEFFEKQAGRRRHGPGVVHRPNRQKPGGPVSWCS